MIAIFLIWWWAAADDDTDVYEPATEEVEDVGTTYLQEAPKNRYAVIQTPAVQRV
ncbi:MAG: hypothetical protein LPK03_05490 [Pontibacter sp.]|nr:hypothetical protein [Pontibacter sp.]